MKYTVIGETKVYEIKAFAKHRKKNTCDSTTQCCQY